MSEFLTGLRFLKLIKALSRKEQIIFGGAGIIFLVTLGVYGALYLQAKTRAEAAAGGEFREGVIGQPVFINPVSPVTEADRDITRLVFSSVAEVADSVKRSPNGKEWYVRLKENVFWHDGQKLTADDIVFTLETIKNPESRSPFYASFQGVTVERVSELEVKFILENPYAFFESDHLQTLRLIPKHIFSDIPVSNFRLSSYALKPIGSGPYEIISYEDDREGMIKGFRLKVHENHFGDKPNIKNITFRFYRNSSELIKAYNRGQIDGFGLVTAEPLAQNKVRIRHNLHSLRSSRYYAVFVNQNLTSQELKKLPTRRTLSETVDRQKIINEVFLSRATPLYGPTNLTSEPSQSSNLASLQGLKLNLTVPEEPFLVKTAQIIKSDWETSGAEVNLKILSLRAVQDEVLKNSDYGMLLFGNITKESQDLFAFWHSSQRFYPDQNLSLYKNSEVDAALERYRKNFNTDDRLILLKRISDTIAADLPAIFLYSPEYIYVTVPQLDGFDDSQIINTGDDRFANVTNWYVKIRRVFK